MIEAAPESLELKRSLFGALSGVVGEDCVLATNTSSLLVTALATAASRPERVVGMHFFNPPPVMAPARGRRRRRLLAAGAGGSPGAGEAMGKHVIEAADGPGFIVNRCNRPWGLEALKLLAEGVATVEQIDRICRLGGGFRMGPFELMDLVGVDVGLDISRSFYEQSFGEPRWRPSPIAVRTVAAGRIGRKSGRGYYEYPGSGGTARPIPTRRPPGRRRPGGGRRRVAAGARTRQAARDAGWEVATPPRRRTRGAVPDPRPDRRRRARRPAAGRRPRRSSAAPGR